MTRHMKGAAAIEFALVAALFFLLLFGAIELGRIFYVWNSAQEVTRRAARAAVVMLPAKTAADLDAIQKMALFGQGAMPAAGEISSMRVNITYLDLNGNPIAASALPDAASDDNNAQACADQASNCIAYVEAQLCEIKGGTCSPVQYLPMVGLFSYFSVSIPVSSVIMPAESMGYTP